MFPSKQISMAFLGAIHTYLATLVIIHGRSSRLECRGTSLEERTITNCLPSFSSLARAGML